LGGFLDLTSEATVIHHLAHAFNIPPANAAVGVGALGVFALTLAATSILLFSKAGKSKKRRRRARCASANRKDRFIRRCTRRYDVQRAHP
jgi:hypothetical protein